MFAREKNSSSRRSKLAYLTAERNENISEVITHISSTNTPALEKTTTKIYS
jgi:hypothetical protein